MFIDWKTILLRWQYSPNSFVDSVYSLYTNPCWIPQGNGRASPKFIWKFKAHRRGQTILKRKKNVPNFTTQYKPTVNNTVCYCDKNKGQWNKIDNPKINPHDKDSKISKMPRQLNEFNWFNCLFSKWYRNSWISTCRRVKLDPFPQIIYKN